MSALENKSLDQSKGINFLKESRVGLASEVSGDTRKLISRWLKVSERGIVHSKHDTRGEKNLQRIKSFFHQEFIPSLETFPREAYTKVQRNAAEELGHGRNFDISDEQIQIEIENQKYSLDRWIEYFTSPDSASFPIWAKYWAFLGVVKMSGKEKIDPETNEITFPKREKNTIFGFPDLNREALALAVEHITNLIEKGINLNDTLKKRNFQDVYSFYLNKIRKEANTVEGELGITQGNWVKYNQGENLEELDKLVLSLEGKNTGWCTAGKPTAQAQLRNGDFYVYYSKSASDKPNPRIAIRMQGASIGEVRGIASDQNLDQIIAGTTILDEKLKDFGSEGEKYKKRNSDMKRLGEVKKKTESGEQLSREELRFLYQIDAEIEGFGYSKDPRIDEIISKRDAVRKDISSCLNCKPEEISLTEREAISGGIKFHYGDLNLKRYYLSSALPQRVSGSLDLSGLNSAKGLTLPQSVGGDILLSGLTSAEGLTLPHRVGGGIRLDKLTSAKGLTLPQNIDGNLLLFGLTSAEGLTLPQNVGGSLDLSGLNSAKGLTLSQNIGGILSLSRLTTAEGLSVPQNAGESIDLSGLISAKGLILPQSLSGGINLGGLTSAEGLILPQSVGGYIELSGLTSAKGLTLPLNVGEGIYLSGLKSAESLTLPQSIGGDISLGLTSAEGLTLPQIIGGHVYLEELTSAEGLTLPQSVGQTVILSILNHKELQEIKLKYPNLRIQP